MNLGGDEIRNACKLFVGKLQVKRPFVRLRRRYKDNGLNCKKNPILEAVNLACHMFLPVGRNTEIHY
jgi:hypothetical protein